MAWQRKRLAPRRSSTRSIPPASIFTKASKRRRQLISPTRLAEWGRQDCPELGDTADAGHEFPLGQMPCRATAGSLLGLQISGRGQENSDTSATSAYLRPRAIAEDIGRPRLMREI